jgi:hypothetical protein
MFNAFIGETHEILKDASTRWARELALGSIEKSPQLTRRALQAEPQLVGGALKRARRLASLKTTAQVRDLERKGVKVLTTPGADMGARLTPTAPRIELGSSGTPGVAGKVRGMWQALTGSNGVDDTVRFGALRHELGEVKDMLRGAPAPHATHAGVTPILEERLAIHGDRAASSVFNAMQSSGDNAEVARLIKQVGGVGGHQVQPGTRRARALERLVQKNTQRSAFKDVEQLRRQADLSELQRNAAVPKYI